MIVAGSWTEQPSSLCAWSAFAGRSYCALVLLPPLVVALRGVVLLWSLN
jgi:hypothetical protein